MPGDDCNINNSVFRKWVDPDGACTAATYPIVQPTWDNGSGRFTVVARALYQTDAGPRFSEPVCIQTSVGMVPPSVADLTASPNPVQVGERLSLIAEIGGTCAMAEAVVFYIMPGTDCDINNYVWRNWVPTNDACSVATYPLVQAGWDDGSGALSVAARAVWRNDQGDYQFSDVLCIQSGVEP
jgi:hypothetical protein